MNEGFRPFTDEEVLKAKAFRMNIEHAQVGDWGHLIELIGKGRFGTIPAIAAWIDRVKAAGTIPPYPVSFLRSGGKTVEMHTFDGLVFDLRSITNSDEVTV